MSAPEQLSAALSDRYILEDQIGVGGMATVYRARDVRHGRLVAVKVLKPELAAVIGGERFLQEIRVTAALQHPHILPLHDSGQIDGIVFYVMPFVGGESLRARIDREKQLPIATAVAIASEVASALDYAHRHGVIHRDIKPENILLHDGRALVVDFGIALAVTAAGGQRMTETGLSLGTPFYMSPEQAMGEREITPRSDVYALGCVLYEMLLGEPPFTGPTAQAIIARVLTEEPRSPTLQRKSIPQHVEQALYTALAKLPADRFETAAQFAAAINDALAPVGTRTGSTTRAARVASARTPSALRLSPALVGALLLASAIGAAAAWAWSRPRGAEPAVATRFALVLPPSMSMRDEPGSLALSPDGRAIVYRTQAAASTLLHRRTLDQLAPTVMHNSEQAALPFVSPNGRWVAFFVGMQLKKTSMDGGPATIIASVSQPRGASWGPNDMIVLGAYSGVDGLSRVSAAGGKPERFTKPDTSKGELSQRWPCVLPDGKTVLYTSWGSGELTTAHIGIASLETGESTILDVTGTRPLGVVEGLLVHARADGALVGVPIDLRERRVTGDAMTLVEGLSIGSDGGVNAAISRSGTLVYVTGSSTSRLAIVSTNGTVRTLGAEPRAYQSPRMSPDGSRIATAIEGPPSDIWMYDIGSGTLNRLTSQATNIQPEWSPDGRRVAFVSNRSGENGIWWLPADGSAPMQKVFESRDDALEMIFSPDGGALVYRSNESGGTYGVWYSSLADLDPDPIFSAASHRERMPSLSSDGRWLAYVSDETGSAEVYVRPFPGPAARYVVSVGGGSEPRWAPDGRLLYYRSGRKMIAARVTTTPVFTVGSRDVLLEGEHGASPNHQSYDLVRDGESFLMLQREAGAEVIVVLDWLAELRARRRVAATK